MSLVQPRWHEKLARALRRRLVEHGSLDVDESVLVEEPAHRHRRAVPQAEIALHQIAPQIEHAVLKPGFFGKLVLVELKRRRRGWVEDLHLLRQNFYFAGRQLGIDRAGRPAPHLARDLQHVLRTHALGGAESVARVRIAHHLRKALAVAQVDEDDAAVIAAPVGPAAQRHDPVDEGGAQFPAVVAAHGDSYFCGGATPMEMMYFRAWSTLMSSSITFLRATMTK